MLAKREEAGRDHIRVDEGLDQRVAVRARVARPNDARNRNAPGELIRLPGGGDSFDRVLEVGQVAIPHSEVKRALGFVSESLSVTARLAGEWAVAHRRLERLLECELLGCHLGCVEAVVQEVLGCRFDDSGQERAAAVGHRASKELEDTGRELSLAGPVYEFDVIQLA